MILLLYNKKKCCLLFANQFGLNIKFQNLFIEMQEIFLNHMLFL